MRRIFSRAGNLLGLGVALGLFGFALWVLHHQLSGHQYRDVLRTLGDLPLGWVAASFAFTILDYLTLTGYDILALRYVGRPLGFRRTALVSFIGYAFSHSLGFPLFTGAPVRFRLYTAWGLSAIEVTEVVAFCAVTYWLGFAAMGGLAFLFLPVPAGAAPLTAVLPRPALGLTLLAVAAAFLLFAIFRKRPVRAFGMEFDVPAPSIAFAQVAVGCVDWAVAAAVLYALLPPSVAVSYPAFFVVFLLAQAAGVASQVPAGLGVFEGMVLLLLSGEAASSHLLASLLAFRAVYYLLPLTAAATLLGATEALRHRGRLQQLGAGFARVFSAVVPVGFAVGAFVAGAILLLSGATPSLEERLHRLNAVYPLPVLELSHLLASLVGGGLLILARGLYNRLASAYALTLALLAAGVAFSLLKGLDYEEAVVVGVMLLTLLPCREHFYRRGSVFEQPFGPNWVLAILVVLGTAGWLWSFSHRGHLPVAELVGRFDRVSQGARSFRATVGALGLLGGFALWHLLKPRPGRAAIGPRELEAAARAAARSRDTGAYLALLGDKQLLFNDSRTAFLMYGIEGRSWIALRDPVGNDDEIRELAWRFRELSDRGGGWTVFYEVSARHLPLYLDLGLTLLKIGEEGRARLSDFSLEGGARAGLRKAHARVAREGCRFQIVPPEEVGGLLGDLQAVSDEWLDARSTREKGFSLGSFDREYLQRFPIAVVRQGDRLLAFANVLRGADEEELSADLMRYRPGPPNGLMEYLFVELLLWGKDRGYQWFTLGMAPFSGLEGRALGPLWNRAGTFLFRHGEHFYNFQGVRTFKEKFSPVWEPRYLASPGGLALPRIVANVAALISGGMKGVVGK